ncbi:alpha/beta fold hydrolase [Streptomyces sp. NPDC051362]|uniref:alpha/beta fold hydrolase n=1 Tax=Streptomyces sp. NPDC051362 TaxID=3365651 RepID=UPI0037AA769B
MGTQATPYGASSTTSEPLSPGPHAYQIGGITQRYHVHGSSGAVCVVHPGGPGLSWEYLRMPGLEQHFTMVYIEPVGTGASGRLPSHPHGYTVDRYSRFLQVLINRLQVPEVYLLGHSYGALVAAHHALYRSERVIGVIAYEGEVVAGPSPDEQWRPLPWDAAATSWGQRLTSTCERLQRSYISGLDENLSPEVVENRAGLRALTVPVLVVTGLREAGQDTDWSRQLCEVAPRSRLQFLERGGRLGHVGDPERFDRAVRDFALSMTYGDAASPSAP